MDTFEFTKKKWSTISDTAKHHHLIKWLTAFYHRLTTNRVNESLLDLFVQQYNQALSWGKMAPFYPPAENKTRLWMEAVSDQIQFHRVETGIRVTDTHLVENISTRDLKVPAHRPDIDCHLALDSLRSLFNLGSIIRTCDAAGFNSVIVGNTNEKQGSGIQKTAMGAEKWVAQEPTVDLFTTLFEKKKQGYQVIGVETIEGAQPYDRIDWSTKTILVLGNEEYGISSHLLPVCDAFAYIPMFGRKNSINVASAASVICFHVRSFLNGKPANRSNDV